MSEDPFDRARWEMDRAHRRFRDETRVDREELRRLVAREPAPGQGRLEHRAERDRLRAQMIERRKEFDLELRTYRKRMDAARKRPPRSSSGGGEKPGGSGPNGPRPVPVRPSSPSFLSGGAAAPLDE